MRGSGSRLCQVCISWRENARSRGVSGRGMCVQSNWVRDKLLPSGSVSQAIRSPFGVVQTPRGVLLQPVVAGEHRSVCHEPRHDEVDVGDSPPQRRVSGRGDISYCGDAKHLAGHQPANDKPRDSGKCVTRFDVSAQMLGEADDEAFGAADVAQPVAVLELRPLAKQFGAAEA